MFSLQEYFATAKPNNGKFFTIAIDGRGGSGKTSLVTYLQKLHPHITFMNGDDYFEPMYDPVLWGDFNDERFRQEVIAPLQSVNQFATQKCEWHPTPHLEQAVKHVVQVAFCLERCYAFDFALNWDIKIWVETPKEACIERLIKRENMPVEKALAAWRVWQAREDSYIENKKPLEQADIILDGTVGFSQQIS